METIKHTTRLWRWTADNGVSWFFLTIDGEAGEALSATALMQRLERGTAKVFGSMKVQVTIGDSRWKTSLFPRKEGGWMLPVKAAIRRAEAIDEGDVVDCVLKV